MTDPQERIARWLALFEGHFSPDDITAVLDEPPNEAMIWLSKALFDPLGQMMGYADLWDSEADPAAVERACGLPMADLKREILREVNALHTAARRATDDYWNEHLGVMSGGMNGNGVSSADPDAAPPDYRAELRVLGDWQALRPQCERVRAVITPVHACLADHAAEEDVMEALQAMAMLVRGAQRVLRALDVARAYREGWRATGGRGGA